MKAKIRRQDIIDRLVEVPDGSDRRFWAKEMTMLKRLEKRYNLEFLNELTFFKKVDSLMLLSSKELRPTLDLKFKKFNYRPVKDPELEYNISEEKFGEDRQIEHAPKTTREFLNG